MSKHLVRRAILQHIILVPLLIILFNVNLWGANGLRNLHNVMELGDLNHNGSTDFAAIHEVAGSNSELITFTVDPGGDFEIIWRFALPENLVGEWVDFTLTDLNLNGRPELVAISKLISAASGNKAPWLYGFEWNGHEFDYIPSFQWGWTPDNGLYARPAQIASSDLDGDGLTELIVSLSAPQANLLIIEFKGDLTTSDIQIEYAGLPQDMTQIPAAILMALTDINQDQQDDILLFQKRGTQLKAAGILATAEDHYTIKALPVMDLQQGAAEVIRNSSIAIADLQNTTRQQVYLGSTRGNIYQYTPADGGSVWQSFNGPINDLAFADRDGDGLLEGLILAGDQLYYVEQQEATDDFDQFRSLVDANLTGGDALSFADGLLIAKQGIYQFKAVNLGTPSDTSDVPISTAPDTANELSAKPEGPASQPPPLLAKLSDTSAAEPATLSAIRRKPKSPDVILHVGESFVHVIPRQDEMDPGQAYVKFKTYPEGMRLGKDFVLRWNPAADQLGYHQISYSFGQNLDTTFTLYVNAIPEIFSTPPPLAQTGQQYLYQVQLEDLNEEQYFEYELLSAPAGMQVDEDGLVRWLPSDTQLDSQYVSLSISDGFERTLQKFTLYVNIPPLIIEKPAPVAFVTEPYIGQIKIQDKNVPNTARVNPVRAPQNLVMESSGRVTWVPEKEQTGFYDILFELTDDMSTVLDSFTIFSNTPPVIKSRYEKNVPVGKPWHYDVEVADPNNNQDISFLLSESTIPNLTISRRGRITWTPTESELGRQSFTISVSDGLRDDLQKVTVYVNSPPEFGRVVDTLATVARPYTTLVPVTDLNKDQRLAFSFLSAPKGMRISPAGQIQWTPAKAQKGWNDIFVKVSDKYSSDTYKFAVYANAPPVIISKPDTMAIAGAEFVYEIKALDLNTDQDLKYALIDAPKGLELTDGSVLRWTPGIDQIGKTKFKVSVTDGYITNVQKVELFVNALPEVTSTPSPVVLTDREYRYKLESRDLNEDSIVYSKVLLPSGAEMNVEEGLITWTPDASNEGSNKFIIQLTDSRGSSSYHEFEVNVFQDPKTPLRQMGAFLITLAGIGAMFIMKFLY